MKNRFHILFILASKYFYTRADFLTLCACLISIGLIWFVGVRYDATNLDFAEEQAYSIIEKVRDEVNFTYTYLDGITGLVTPTGELDQSKLDIYSDFFLRSSTHLPLEEVGFIPYRDGQLRFAESIVKFVDLSEDSLVVFSGTELPILQTLVTQLLNTSETQLLLLARTEAGYVDAIGKPSVDAILFAKPIKNEQEMSGVVFTLISVSELVNQSGLGLDPTTQWSWTSNRGARFFTSIEASTENTYQAKYVLPNEIDTWVFSSSVSTVASDFWNMFLLYGLVVSFLLYIVVYLVTSTAAQSRLLASELSINLQKYKMALDSSYSHVVITDADGKILYANQAVAKTTGFSNKEVIGKTPRLWGQLMSTEFYKKMWHTIKVEQKVFQGELTNRKKNGEKYTAKATISPIISDTNQLLGFIGIEEDVSDQKKYEQKLLQSKAEVDAQVKLRTRELSEEKIRLAAAIESLPQAFIILDANLAVVSFNSHLNEFLGNQSQAWSTQLVAALLKDELDLVATIKKVVNKKTPFILEEVRYNDRVFKLYIVPMSDERDHFLGAIITLRDRTQEYTLNRAKEEFFSIASHELRTPLTAIRGNTSLMLEYYADELKNPDLKVMVGDMHEASVRLIGIVNDFLDSSRLEQGDMKFELENCELPDFVEKVISEFKQPCKEKQNQLNVKKSQKMTVLADATKLHQILSNLIGNANKFCEKGSITISFEKLKNSALIEITDTGIGIPRANQNLLFKKFQQAGTSLATRDTTKGTGLGLYISRMLAEGMGGTLKLVSSDEGKGTTFALTLPLAKK